MKKQNFPLVTSPCNQQGHEAQACRDKLWLPSAHPLNTTHWLQHTQLHTKPHSRSCQDITCASQKQECTSLPSAQSTRHMSHSKISKAAAGLPKPMSSCCCQPSDERLTHRLPGRLRGGASMALNMASSCCFTVARCSSGTLKLTCIHHNPHKSRFAPTYCAMCQLLTVNFLQQTSRQDTSALLWCCTHT